MFSEGEPIADPMEVKGAIFPEELDDGLRQNEEKVLAPSKKKPHKPHKGENTSESKKNQMEIT